MAGMTPRELVARDAEATALRRAGREEDRPEALALEVGQPEVAAHRGVEPELHPEADDPGDLGSRSTSRGRRYSGIPIAIMPPGTGIASRTVTG